MYNIMIRKVREFNFKDKDNKDYQHLLFMCNEIEQMKDSLKSARWIGYVCRMVEELGFWDNNTSRDYIREDVRMGNE